MKLAIMQPYFLPYLGYFQLMSAVDKFVIFDDVNYIQRGWINRNRILLNGEAHTFTIPLVGASQNRQICDLELAPGPWRPKLLRTIQQAYARAPYFHQTFELCEQIINCDSPMLDGYILNSLELLAQRLQIGASVVTSSRVYKNSELKGQMRILDICQREQADVYVNAPGGAGLYSQQMFEEKAIKLLILHPEELLYQQFRDENIAGLSVLDVLMFNSVEVVKELLQKRSLVAPGAPELAGV
jgi:hypothetical protein